MITERTKKRSQLDRKDELALDKKLREHKGWRNVLFFKDGKSVSGELIHETETAAKAVADRANARLAREAASLKPGEKLVIYWDNGMSYMCDDYRHTIQMPVGE